MLPLQTAPEAGEEQTVPKLELKLPGGFRSYRRKYTTAALNENISQLKLFVCCFNKGKGCGVGTGTKEDSAIEVSGAGKSTTSHVVSPPPPHHSLPHIGKRV